MGGAKGRQRVRVWGGGVGTCSAGPGCGGRGRRSWGRVGVGSRSWVGDDETAPLVPLHVSHTSDRLDLRGGGLPVVPVFEVSSLKDELAPPVAWIHVADPSGGREHRQQTRYILIPLFGNVLVLNCKVFLDLAHCPKSLLSEIRTYQSFGRTGKMRPEQLAVQERIKGARRYPKGELEFTPDRR